MGFSSLAYFSKCCTSCWRRGWRDLTDFFVLLQKTTAKMNAATDVISKEAVLNSLNKMPDQIPIDALLDEIIYLFKVESSLRKSQKGEGITIEEFRQKVKTWAK